MALTSIGDRKTPTVPIEIVTEPELGLPSDLQQILMLGHAASSTAASSLNVVKVVNNVADSEAAKAELEAIYGTDSEIVKMVVAAIKANEAVGASTFPGIKVIGMPSTYTDFGPADETLVAARNVSADFIVSPYDGMDSANRTKLKDHVALVSGANRTDNLQFGSFGVIFNRSTTDPSTLDAVDTQLLFPVWGRDTGTGADAPEYSIAEMAAASAGLAAANGIPFNPLDSKTIGGIAAPKKQSDWISVGAGLESESCLNRGWTPLRVKPNEEVAFVRTVTGRITNGVSAAPVTAYYDLQDWQILYYWRRTEWNRANQPDFRNVKASREKAIDLRSEFIRLAKVFEINGMFQSVDQLAPQFKVQRSQTDRHRFDSLSPVNVIPGLHVIANRISAGVQFDAFTI